METLGKRIAQLRRQHELKQEELAAMLSVSPQAVSKWENDQTCPDITALPSLAKILGVTVDEQLAGAPKEKAPTVRLLPPDQRRDLNDMILHIVAETVDGDKVRVNLPMALIPVMLEMGMEPPQFSNSSTMKNIDLNQILTLVHQGFVGNLIEVEDADGDKVRIFVE